MQRKWRRAWLRGKPSFMKAHFVRKLHQKTFTSKVYTLTASAAKKLMPAAAAAGIFLSAMTGVQANPAGGSITAGTGSITGQGTNNVTINQASDKLSINWNSFNIGSGEKVQFIQPGTSSIALNRVLGNNASAIYGRLSANGKVFLLNPNGLLFAKGAEVNVGGLVASTLHLSDNDFLNGKYTFSGTSQNGVLNQGNITAANGGYVALLGANAANEGVIVAQQGTVAMGAGSKVTLDFTGDGLLTLSVDESKVKAEVKNSGLIKADGGLVVMNAKAADALTGSVVNNTGTIEAKSVTNKNGTIILEGDAVTNTGTLDASGKTAGEIGGTVKVLGDTVRLASGSTVDVAGDKGGGTVLVGGAYQGGDSEYAATTTTVENGTSINADAITTGNGGQVVIWAKDTTNFAGAISAKGGSALGDGGSVETSGHKTLTIANTASVNTTAAKGQTGNWLLDPADFVVDDTGMNGMTAAALSAALQSSSVTITTTGGTAPATAVKTSDNTSVGTNGDISGNGDITINSAVNWDGANTVLTLSAYRSIKINADITAYGKSAGLALTYGTGGSSVTGAAYSLGNGDKITLSGESAKFSLNGANYTVLNSHSTGGALTALQNIKDNLSGKYFLGEDIDDASVTSTWNSGAGFIPIGDVDNRFIGAFDGGGHTISGLTIHSSAASVGLFGVTGFDSKISNVGLVGGSVTGTGANSNVGGLVGGNFGSITNAYNTGSVTGTGDNSNVGGLTGSINNGSITGSYNTGSVTGTGATSYVGGLTGENNNVSIAGSYNTGSVTSTYAAGGLVGYNFNHGSVMGSYNTGSVIGTRISLYAGGLVGFQDNYGNIENAYNNGSVTGSFRAGGLVGYQINSSIKNVYNTGSVTGTSNVGGLVGRNSGSITNAYNTGDVTGTAGSYAGGLVGYLDSGSISNSYWDVGTTGRTKGVGNAETVSGATGMTTAELMAALPTGFDSSTWGIISGISYPYLKWRYPVTPQVVSGSLVNTSTYSGQTVKAAANGTLLASTTTGANGFYYFLFDNNTIANGTSLLTYLDNGSVKANTVKFIKGTNNSVPYLNLAGGNVQVYGGDAAGDGALDVNALLASGKGSLTDSDILYTASGGSIAVNGSLGVCTNYVPLTVSNALSASGNIYLLPIGDIILAETGSVTSIGGDAFLASKYGHFLNHNTSTNAVSAANGRRLIYSVSPTGNMYGNLNYDFSQYNTSWIGGPMNILGAGNGFIYKSALTLSAALTGTVTKPYDGSTTVNIQADNLSIDTGSLSGATATYTGSGLSAAYNSKNVAEATTVTLTDVNAANTEITHNSSILDSNHKNVYGYTVSLTNDATAGTITAKALSAAQTAAVTKTYSKTDSAAFDNTNLLLSGVVDGDSVNVSGTGIYDSVNAGDSTVTITGVTLDNANYSLSASHITGSTAGELAGKINPRALTAVQTAIVKKAYNKDDVATFDSSNISLNTANVLAGDTVSIVGGTGIYDSVNAGDRTVTVTGVILDNTNYSLNGSNITGGTAGTLIGKISPQDLTIMAVTNSKTYDGTTSAMATPTYTGLQTGDSLTDLVEEYTDKNVGSGKTLTVTGYTIKDGNNGGNYTVSLVANTTGNIKPATITDPGYTAAVRSTQQNPESNIGENGKNTAYPPATHGTPQQMPAGQVSPIQYGRDNTGATRVITISGQTVTVAQDGLVQLNINPVQKDIAVYQMSAGTVSAATAYHVDSSRSALSLRATQAQAPAVPEALQTVPPDTADSASFALVDAQGNTAAFTIIYTNGILRVEAANSAAAAMLSQNNQQLITATALAAAQDKLGVDVEELQAVYLEQ